MFYKVEMIGITCDNCGCHYEQNFTGYTVFADTNNVFESAIDNGWNSDEDHTDRHYCPDCHFIDEDDNLVVKPVPPIYEVIAGFPNNKDFPIGKIITFEQFGSDKWQHKVNDCQGERIWLSDFFNGFPHLFKKRLSIKI